MNMDASFYAGAMVPDLYLRTRAADVGGPSEVRVVALARSMILILVNRITEDIATVTG